ncbi:MAG: alkaline phosphatase [Bacteroidia bacterium]|nr:MAG: alkaline phosphatase [Bacteroidia bacterium]
MKNLFFLLFAIVLMACNSSVNGQKKPDQPTKIIFLIGDGMGLSAVTTGFYYGEQPSVFTRFKEIGLQQTSSAKEKVTDSAASGTALATGTKTYNGAIGVDTSLVPHQSIVELTASLGWSTGVVATSTISHATPASFYAHVEQRVMEDEIAAQLLSSEIDFFAGGGLARFIARADSANLLPLAAEKGFLVDTTKLAAVGSLEAGQKYGFLLAMDGMPLMIQGRGDFLPDATSLAISHLSQNPKGFFLMVEGSQIDWAGHAKNTEYLVSEMLDFEKTIAAALDYAEKDGNTLVVVTADHETGGFALAPQVNEENPYGNYAELGPVFATGHHSATLIPVFSYGPGAENFKGVYQNTDIFHKMAALVKVE